MSACIVLLCNGRHNGWRWAICITLCNHRNVFLWVLRLYMSSYGMCPYVFCILHSTRFWVKRRGFAVINIVIISYLVV